jgi:hypothetical protein
LDDRAGAAHIARSSAVIPRSNNSSPGTLKARELRLQAIGETTRVESAEGPGLFVYEFRIAHR